MWKVEYLRAALDAIIAVGYWVNSRQATQFRIWATRLLREYVIKGFVMDDERLKGDGCNPANGCVLIPAGLYWNYRLANP